MLFIVASYADSIVRFRGDLIDAVLGLGYQVHVAAPGLSEDSMIRRSLVEKGVHVHDIPLSRAGLNPFSDVYFMLRLLVLFIRVRPSFILCYTIKPVIYGMLAGWLASVPRRCAMVTGLGYAFTGGSQGKRGFVKLVARRLYGFSLRKAHLVFFQNKDDKDLLLNSGVLSGNVSAHIVNGSGVNVDYFKFSEPKENDFVFLLIARLLGDKGVREYVEAALRVKADFPRIRFQIAGWIDENPDAVRKEELDSWTKLGIEYLGKLEDVRPAINSCSVYVLPSYREGTPRTVLEAMAIGRPVITTDAPGCRETVVHGLNGYLVPVKSVAELEVAMKSFVQNPDLVVKMGRESRRIVEDKYDVHKVNEVMMKRMGMI